MQRNRNVWKVAVGRFPSIPRFDQHAIRWCQVLSWNLAPIVPLCRLATVCKRISSDCGVPAGCYIAGYFVYSSVSVHRQINAEAVRRPLSVINWQCQHWNISFPLPPIIFLTSLVRTARLMFLYARRQSWSQPCDLVFLGVRYLMGSYKVLILSAARS